MGEKLHLAEFLSCTIHTLDDRNMSNVCARAAADGVVTKSTSHTTELACVFIESTFPIKESASISIKLAFPAAESPFPVAESASATVKSPFLSAESASLSTCSRILVWNQPPPPW
jgi:hypothetical protein